MIYSFFLFWCVFYQILRTSLIQLQFLIKGHMIVFLLHAYICRYRGGSISSLFLFVNFSEIIYVYLIIYLFCFFLKYFKRQNTNLFHTAPIIFPHLRLETILLHLALYKSLPMPEERDLMLINLIRWIFKLNQFPKNSFRYLCGIRPQTEAILLSFHQRFLFSNRRFLYIHINWQYDIFFLL